MTATRGPTARPRLRIASACLAALFLLVAAMPTVNAESLDVKDVKDLKGNSFMEEVAANPEDEVLGWNYLYSAYSCVCHNKWALASRWLRDALYNGAGTQILQSRSDLGYLCNGLNKIATKRNHAPVTTSSPQAQILQAFILSTAGSEEEAIDALKRVVLNNPNYPSLEFVKQKIRAMEFELADKPWLTPPDVVQNGGNSSRFSKWRTDKFPLRVYIPTDAGASRVAGYRAGDGQLLLSI